MATREKERQTERKKYKDRGKHRQTERQRNAVSVWHLSLWAGCVDVETEAAT